MTRYGNTDFFRVKDNMMDLVDGLTDVIFIDRRNAETGRKKYSPIWLFFCFVSCLILFNLKTPFEFFKSR